MRICRATFAFAVILTMAAIATAQTCPASGTWATINYFQHNFGNAILLTDGTVMLQAFDANNNRHTWYQLTPDATGNYVTGTITYLTQIPQATYSYDPLWYSSAVLADGRFIIQGGEFGDNWPNGQGGFIYDPTTGTWTPLPAPPSFGTLAMLDDPSVVLPNGQFMVGDVDNSRGSLLQAIYNPSSGNWTATGTNKYDKNAEEGWTLLPDGTVLTIDTKPAGGNYYEIFNSSNGTWTHPGTTPVQLYNGNTWEIGPAVLRPDGTVLATGASTDGVNAGHWAVYDSVHHTWPLSGNLPTIMGGSPSQQYPLQMSDQPAALLPDGNVLAMMSPVNSGPQSAYFFEWTGSQFCQVTSPYITSGAGIMLVLPTGQILLTLEGTNIQVYTPSQGANPALAPQLTTVPGYIGQNGSYEISGKYLNGWSQASMYGDDVQNATNYPLVRVTNSSNGHVRYCRTHDHSSMGVANPNVVSTIFDVPVDLELGPSTLEVVANGISSSTPVTVTNSCLPVCR